MLLNILNITNLHVTSARWWIPNLDPPIMDLGIQLDVLIDVDAPKPDPAFVTTIQVLIEGK